jgi:DNA-binding Xre family transcriptional regulator
MRVKVSYRWHLRQLMAARGMFATSDLVPLLASRGVKLSREQVYRLVARTPERLSLATLAALCDILEVSPGELIEPVRDTPAKTARTKTAAEAPLAMGSLSDLRPRPARVAVAKR